MHLLMNRGALVGFSDPHVASIKVDDVQFTSGKMKGEIDRSDCVVV
jgi:hypothetical protein